MFKNHPIKEYLVYSIIAAVAYFIVICIFLNYESFTSMWMLYVGNAFFAISIATFVLMYNWKRRENANTAEMIFAGHITTAMGVIIVCVLLVIVYLVAPDVFNSIPKGTTSFLKAPPQMAGRSDSFIFTIFMNAIIGNVSTGSFISIILPYAAKRNQKNDSSVINADTSEA
jgi:nicotinamide riboside transporter PnuC